MPEATVHPLLAQFDAELHAVAEKFRTQHPDWWFWYSAARMKPVAPQKAASIQHKTEIIKLEPGR